MLLGEKNLSPLRRFGFLVGDTTQRLRTGLVCAAPPALGKKGLGERVGYSGKMAGGETQEAGIPTGSGQAPDQRYI